MPDSPEQTPDDVFRTAVLFELALGLLALFLGWLLGPDPRRWVPEFTLSDMRPVGEGLLYGLLAAAPLIAAIEVIRRIPWEPIRELERLSEDGMVSLLLRLGPTELIVISICAGVGEELLFRGWMMPWMAGGDVEGWSVATVGGLLGSSLAFGLVHPITKLYVVLAALMGLYFGVLVLVTGNLLIPIVAHAAYDAAQLIMTARRERDEATGGD